MDRNILTIGEQFNAADIDQTNKNAYIAIAKLAMGILGSDTLLNGFDCTPNSPANLNVQVAAGEIYQLAEVDSTPYGDLPVDSHIILKQGINSDPVPNGTFTFTAPSTPGQSVDYLIEFALQEDDVNDENRQFFEESPQVVATLRQDSVFVKALAGTPAPTGTQTPPSPEAGFVGGWVITIANGQTTITSGNIAQFTNAPFITEKLKDKISQAFADARYALKTAAVGVVNTQVFTSSGTYTPSVGLLYAQVEVIGAGGGGGGASGGGGTSSAGAGGGGGGYARGIFDAATIGSSQTVTIGAPGTGGTGNVIGNNGGTCSFGILLSASGGLGGNGCGAVTQGGSVGGLGGAGAGGDIQGAGDTGGNGVVTSPTDCASGGGGGTTYGGGGLAQVDANGGNGQGYGGGGAGAGNHGVSNRTGGTGASGVVIVTEYIVST
jgi:hypothetical protein